MSIMAYAHGGMDNPFTRTNRADEIIGFLGLQPGTTVLDAGCGPGRLSIPLARAVRESGGVVALDIQQGMLDRVTQKVRVEGLKNVSFVNGSLDQGVLPEGHYDRVLLVTVLGRYPTGWRRCGRSSKLSERGGMLSVTEIVCDPHFLGMKTVARTACEAGFVKGPFVGNRLAYTVHFIKPG